MGLFCLSVWFAFDPCDYCWEELINLWFLYWLLLMCIEHFVVINDCGFVHSPPSVIKMTSCRPWSSKEMSSSSGVFCFQLLQFNIHGKIFILISYFVLYGIVLIRFLALFLVCFIISKNILPLEVKLNLVSLVRDEWILLMLTYPNILQWCNRVNWAKYLFNPRGKVIPVFALSSTQRWQTITIISLS